MARTGGDFDRSLDECLFTTVAFEDRYARLELAVYRYNGGAQKVQVSRQRKEDGQDWKFTKAGRFTFDEFEALMRSYAEMRKVSLDGAPSAEPPSDWTDDLTPF